MVVIQNNKSNTAIPVVAVVVGTSFILLISCFLGWAFWFAIVVKSDSRTGEIYAAYKKFGITLLFDCFVAAVIFVLTIAGGSCCKAKLNRAALCCIVLAGATSLVKVFFLTHYTFDIVYYEHKIPLSAWIICSLPCLFWITAGLLILKFPGNEDDTHAIAELDTESLLAELGEGTTA
jgi:hypothetical protein